MDRVRIRILRCGRMSPPAAMYPGVPEAYIRRGRVELPVSAFLIELPGHKPVLVDTGWGRAISPAGVYDYTAAHAKLPSRLCAYWRPVTPSGASASEQLAALGLSPADLETVLLTSLEPDHVAGVEEVRTAPRIELPEQEKFWTPRTVYAVRQPRSLWEHLPVKPFYYRGAPDGPFRRTWDLLGDGSVLCISTPGYTEGACVLRVNAPSGKFALVQSSVAVCRAVLGTENVPLAGFNREFQKRSLAWLTEMSREKECAAVLFGHDPEEHPRTIEF